MNDVQIAKQLTEVYKIATLLADARIPVFDRFVQQRTRQILKTGDGQTEWLLATISFILKIICSQPDAAGELEEAISAH
mgnify:CR=1 FL=1